MSCRLDEPPSSLASGHWRATCVHSGDAGTIRAVADSNRHLSLVEPVGFGPTTSCVPRKRAARLRQGPMVGGENWHYQAEARIMAPETTRRAAYGCAPFGDAHAMDMSLCLHSGPQAGASQGRRGSNTHSAGFGDRPPIRWVIPM